MANVAVRTLNGGPVRFALPPGATVWEIVEQTTLPADNLMVLNHGAQVSDWDYVTKDGDSIAILLVPAGGGGRGGGKALISAIAMIAITFAAPLFGALASNAVGGLSIAAQGYAATAFKLVAMLAVSALVPPASAGGQEQQSTYFFTGQSNQAKPYGIVPRIYGRVKIAPNVAATTIIENVGTTSRIANLYDFGIGDLDISDIRIGDTPIASFTSEYRAWAAKGRQNLQYMTAAVGYQQVAFEMKDSTPVYLSTKDNTLHASIDITFPQGLVNSSAKGEVYNFNVEFLFEYKPAASTTWERINGTFRGADIVSEGNGQVMLTGRTYTPFVLNCMFHMYHGAGKYDFRITRITPFDGHDRAKNTTTVTLIKSWSADNRLFESPVTHTLLEFRMVASEKISGNVNNLTAIAHSKLRWFDANLNEQAPATTRNPAWVVLDILTGEANPRPLTIDQIDLASFRRLADFCDETVTTNVGGVVTTGPRHLCDLVVDFDTTVAQLCSSILSGCRSQLLITQSGKYGVFIDREQSVSRQLFTPDNSWNFSGSRTFIDIPHAMRVSFTDPDANWAQSEVIVYNDGYNANNATIFEELDTVGMTRGASAWRYGRYMLAQGIHRSEVLELTVDVENIVVQRGERVSVAHDVPKIGGMAARLVGLNGSRAKIDQPTDTAFTHYTVRRQDGTMLSGTTTFDDGEHWTLSNVTGVNNDDLIVLGYADRVTKEYLITEIQPGEDMSATLRMVAYEPAVYTADEGVIPPWNPGFGNDGVGGVFGVNITSATATQTVSYPDRLPLIAINLGWTASGPLGAVAEYRISASRDGRPFEEVGSAQGSTFIHYINPRTEGGWLTNVVYRITPVSKLGATGGHGDASIRPAGDTSPPSPPTYFAVNVVSNNLIEMFWGPSPDLDIERYELRYSPHTSSTDWNSSQPLSEVSWQTSHTSVGARTGTYMIRAVDTSGNASTPLFRRTTVETLPDINEIKVLDDTSTGYPGAKSGLTVDRTTLVTAAGANGTYTFADSVDLADVFEVRISSKIVAKAIAPITKLTVDAAVSDWDVWLEVRAVTAANMMSSWVTLASINPIGQGSAAWGPWRQVQVGDFTGRMFQFRIQCVSKAPGVIVVIQEAKVAVDVPDRVWGVQDVNIAAAGTRISFDPSFMEPPVIAVTIDGNSDDVFTRLSARDRSGVTVALVNATGAQVTGKVDILAKGYGRKGSAAI